MTDTTKKTTNKVTYEAIKNCLSDEAATLIPDSILKQILADEKIRFDNARLLDISPSQFVGNNTMRHCKDLLRQKQPLSFLYTLLCILSETSILVLLYGLLLRIPAVLLGNTGFLAPFSFLYELVLFSGIICGNTLLRKQLQTALTLPFSSAAPSKEEITERKKGIRKKRCLSLVLIVIVMLLTAGIIAFQNFHNSYTINISICFFAYVACMLLMGIHNVIFSSHLISFLEIGTGRLLRKSKSSIENSCTIYLTLSYRQILSQSHKTMADCTNNPTLFAKLKKTVHRRTITARVYNVLAFFIVTVLDIICIAQLNQNSTITFLLFFALSLLLTLLFLIAILSADYVLKQTKNGDTL